MECLRSRWTIESSTSFELLRHRAHRNRLYSFTWKDSLAVSLPSRSKKRCLCMAPVQGPVASVSQASQFAQSHQKPMRLRGSHRRRIRRGRAPAAGQPCPRAHSTRPSRAPWNDYCDAREESAEGLADSCQGVVWSRQQPPLHRCGHFRTSRDPSTRTKSEDSSASVLCCTRPAEYSSMQRKTKGHDLAWGSPLVGLFCPDARPYVHLSPAEVSAVVAWHREAKSGNHDDAKADSCRGETCRSSRTAGTGEARRKGQKTARQTETGSRSSRS